MGARTRTPRARGTGELGRGRAARGSGRARGRVDRGLGTAAGRGCDVAARVSPDLSDGVGTTGRNPRLPHDHAASLDGSEPASTKGGAMVYDDLKTAAQAAIAAAH